MIVWGASSIFVAALLMVSVVALLPELKNQLTVIPAEGTFTAPDISINFPLVDSNRVKNLEVFEGIPSSNQLTVGRADPFLPANQQTIKK